MYSSTYTTDSEDKYMINYDDLQKIFNDYVNDLFNNSYLRQMFNDTESTPKILKIFKYLENSIEKNGNDWITMQLNVNDKNYKIDDIKDDNEHNHYVNDLFKDIEDLL